ncbi:hypothetical protein HD806DRAFT_386263 [Xylariaceae sp. AK1471]|nr:hypothetical protein HD806DRAFT_386263 [Xylariaceae sp. AK1471]
MAVFEIVLPQLKKDAALIKELEKTVVPVFQKKLHEAGALFGLRGFFVTENGRDVRDEFREILVLEWPTAQHFKTFISSPGFHKFIGELQEKKAATGPPELKLFDYDSSSDEVSSIYKSPYTVLEYLVIKPTNASEASVHDLLQKLRSGFGSPSAAAVIGSSSNLDTQEIAVVGLYASDADLDAAKASTTRQQLLAEIASAADVKSLVAHVEKVIPIA